MTKATAAQTATRPDELAHVPERAELFRRTGEVVEGVPRNRYRRDRNTALHLRTTRDAAKILYDEFLDSSRIEIASDSERRIIRCVVGLEEVLHVSQRCRAEIRH